MSTTSSDINQRVEQLKNDAGARSGQQQDKMIASLATQLSSSPSDLSKNSPWLMGLITKTFSLNAALDMLNQVSAEPLSKSFDLKEAQAKAGIRSQVVEEILAAKDMQGNRLISKKEVEKIRQLSSSPEALGMGGAALSPLELTEGTEEQIQALREYLKRRIESYREVIVLGVNFEMTGTRFFTKSDEDKLKFLFKIHGDLKELAFHLKKRDQESIQHVVDGLMDIRNEIPAIFEDPSLTEWMKNLNYDSILGVETSLGDKLTNIARTVSDYILHLFRPDKQDNFIEDPDPKTPSLFENIKDKLNDYLKEKKESSEEEAIKAMAKLLESHQDNLPLSTEDTGGILKTVYKKSLGFLIEGLKDIRNDFRKKRYLSAALKSVFILIGVAAAVTALYYAGGFVMGALTVGAVTVTATQAIIAVVIGGGIFAFISKKFQDYQNNRIIKKMDQILKQGIRNKDYVIKPFFPKPNARDIIAANALGKHLEKTLEFLEKVLVQERPRFEAYRDRLMLAVGGLNQAKDRTAYYKIMAEYIRLETTILAEVRGPLQAKSLMKQITKINFPDLALTKENPADQANLKIVNALFSELAKLNTEYFRPAIESAIEPTKKAEPKKTTGHKEGHKPAILLSEDETLDLGVSESAKQQPKPKPSEPKHH